ncbi:MAG: hypothetical protein BWY43_00232 [candidate division WS2 bacterium ADurb.Bin280]|uniref:Uncharacterized protein n=1 Tax=candidate division WS2 bacterium ADurb.Bin280 TaxID=1852829 RepID=A0A1V5SEP1_9BACT|nr:MAG: hypothetical protein BWY43_00232 [candidate division WS2 bacterium ADurb.Bin280]
MSGLETAADNAGGSKLLYSTDSESKINKFGYEMYQMGREGTQIKPISDFVADTGIVVWEDAYGQYIPYLYTEYAPLVECGKPVVYLYPDSETPFEVKVGANVTVSEPSYGSGWSGTAKPSGQLIVNGKTYPNLFWEGLGWGVYPQINSGTVVAAKDAEATIRSQLQYMNLNDQEITDFMEFWSPKLPKSNYVRISWIYGEEMDNLAPLYVNPKPDSVIRVFMDFAALDEIVDIKSQQLPKFERKGFTVVEWGGLLVK